MRAPFFVNVTFAVAQREKRIGEKIHKNVLNKKHCRIFRLFAKRRWEKAAVTIK